MRMDAPGSMELTSGVTTRLMTPSSSTVGVKPRLTPNGLNSTVMEEPLRPPSPPVPFCATGTGNSPPARNEAVSPESATRLGSARVLTTPLRSSASSTVVMFSSPMLKEPPTMPKVSSMVPRSTMGRPAASVSSVVPTGSEPVPPKTLPLLLMKALLMPISLATVRTISEKRTSSRTCCAAPTDIMLTTLPGA